MGPEPGMVGPRGRTVWDTLAEVLVSPSAIIIAALILLIIVVAAILIRTGHLAFSGKGVKVGRVSNPLAERYVLKKQIEWLDHFLLGLLPKIHKLLEQHPEGVACAYKREPEYYLKWVISCMGNYIITHWFFFNALSTDKKTMHTRVNDLIVFLGALTNNEHYDDKVFSEYITEWAEEVNKNALRIRHEYEGRI